MVQCRSVCSLSNTTQRTLAQHVILKGRVSNSCGVLLDTVASGTCLLTWQECVCQVVMAGGFWVVSRILRPDCYPAWVSQKHGQSGAASTVSRSCRSVACGPSVTHVDIAEDTDVWGLLAV